MAFDYKRNMQILSGVYVSSLLHNIGNAKNDFMFTLNLFGVNEKATTKKGPMD